MIEKQTVMNKGYVTLHEARGNDLSVVNAARVSYNKESHELTKKDEGLIRFLGRDGHTSPFRHSTMVFEVYAPLMVARQWWKYIIGSDHADQPFSNVDRMVGWNESSRRYISDEIEFVEVSPAEWRSAPANSKQGSGAPIDSEKGKEFTEMLESYQRTGLMAYESALENGIAPEQARLFLPAYGLFVRWRWHASLQGVCHFLYQRLKHDAQSEIRDYAEVVYDMAIKHFPNAIKAAVDTPIKQDALLEHLRGLGIEDIDTFKEWQKY